jgi:aryl carrier-like protein
MLPTLVAGSGWSESKEQLHNDMNLLLVGGNGSVKIVIIIKWTKLQGGRVSGTVELFMRDRNGMPRLEQSEVC